MAAEVRGGSDEEGGRMAYAFVIVQTDPRNASPDFWNLTRDVYPMTPTFSTDVMLIQSLLVAYFMAPAGPPAHLKAKAVSILRSVPGRFDDGYYGQKTRDVLRLFEEAMNAPYKDGIVRTVPPHTVTHGPETKLKRLNFEWNMTMLGGAMGQTKKESGRQALKPILFGELYPGG
jgi:hypothetical protein